MEFDGPKVASINEYTWTAFNQFILKYQDIQYHCTEKNYIYITSLLFYW